MATGTVILPLSYSCIYKPGIKQSCHSFNLYKNFNIKIMKNANHYAIIMAGGAGARFWPVSREAYPKQFIDMLHTGKSLLQEAFERYESLILKENIYVVTADKYIDIVKTQLPDIPENNIIGEPERKNTAACVIYLALKINKLNPKSKLIFAPSDQLISPVENFDKICFEAFNFIEENNALLTIGVRPSNANTGYGYIQMNGENVRDNIFGVKRFTEKPDLKTAELFVNSGEYFWNAGIFIWKAVDIINSFRFYMPDMLNIFLPGVIDFNTEREKAAVAHTYKYCNAISIDYAIMEKAKNVYVLPADFEWSDLGTWESAWRHSSKDQQGNVIAGEKVFAFNTQNTFIHAGEKKVIVVSGLEEMIVVNTADVLLICKKENEQLIKEYVERIKKDTNLQYI